MKNNRRMAIQATLSATTLWLSFGTHVSASDVHIVYATPDHDAAVKLGSDSVVSENSGTSPSEELMSMFQQDQGERQAVSTNPKSDQWVTISAHDKQHHDRVLELLKQEKIVSADDYFYAAMIMQHGETPRDYMLAHILAEASAHLGNKTALWLTAASFDRLMQSAGQAQVFGTQFFANRDELYHVKEPLATDLIPDSVRKIFHVPPLSENDALLKQMNALRKPGAAN